MPPLVLSAIATTGFRLHMHFFKVRPSLSDRHIRTRDDPLPIHPDDYKLITSPALSSIVVRIYDFDDRTIHYSLEAMLRMVSGMAPNLAHVCLIQHKTRSFIARIRMFLAIGHPLPVAWSGSLPPLPNDPGAGQQPTLSRLQSLVIPHHQYVSIEQWTQLIDFNSLRCLSFQ